MNYTDDTNHIDDSDIAVIGMVCRFPQADNLDQFWKNLKNGVESISFFTDEELQHSGVDPEMLKDPNYVKAGGVIENIDKFDAAFFDYSPREAQILDPQHRLFLEYAWELLETAAYDPDRYRGLIGVYAGTSLSTYAWVNIFSNPDIVQSVGGFQIAIANEKDHLATRIAYHLNLTGPAINIQTACSTSLVAIHLASQGLLNGECDMALAGGVSIDAIQKSGYMYSEGGINSPDGHCRAFDAQAQGTVSGSGLGLVLLKRLSEAVEDGDTIYAVVKGTAINNDGSGKVGYTAPGVSGQARVILDALAVSRIEADTIRYVETHGTATPLGDPIEIAALTEAFHQYTQRKQYCAVGSVKTNVGHLDAAAGIVGFIKTVLSLKHQLIPPSLHFNEPNPNIDFSASPFFVNAELALWKAAEFPRRAGVSSFGLGGTNAHVILEEAPVIDRPPSLSRPWRLLLLSAKTESAMSQMAENLAHFLEEHPEQDMADVAYTLQIGRKAFEYRMALVCNERNEAVGALRLRSPQHIFTGVQESHSPSVVFMFAGVGDDYVNMARGLYETEPIFRQHVDRCFAIFSSLLSIDLREVLYPEPMSHSETSAETAVTTQPAFNFQQFIGRDDNIDSDTLNQTSLLQPALFATEYALAQLWLAWGIVPEVVIGHSLGEYVAACIAGVFSLEDALFLVAKRAQLIQALPAGAMLAVFLGEDALKPYLGKDLSLAAVNNDTHCVVSGTTSAIVTLQEQLVSQGVAHKRLAINRAFHSDMMLPIADQLTTHINTVVLNPPQIPYISCVTGDWITPTQATDPNYWAQHMCGPVFFANGLKQLSAQKEWVLLEIGPGQSLGTFVMPAQTKNKTILPTLRFVHDQRSDSAFILQTLAKLWLSGVDIDWLAFYTNEKRQRVQLPAYPFEHQQYWIEARQDTQHNKQVAPVKKRDLADWFYLPTWKQCLPILPSAPKVSRWLMFIDELGVGENVVTRLRELGHSVTAVTVGAHFSQRNEDSYTLNPRNRQDYHDLIEKLKKANKIPDKIVHMWNISTHEKVEPKQRFLEECLQLGCYSLLALTQALGQQNITIPLNLWVVSNYVNPVETGDILHPEKATVLGPVKVIPQEYTNITCNHIDIGPLRNVPELSNQIIAECQTNQFGAVLAYRRGNRWQQIFEPIHIPSQGDALPQLRDQGVYLITGGLGYVGLMFAQYLTQAVQAKLVLTSRSGLPERSGWDEWITTHGEQDKVSQRIRKVQSLEGAGAEVLVLKADVSDESYMQKALARTCEQFGDVHGVIHAAGLLDGIHIRTIPELDPEHCEMIFKPKIEGLYVLEKVFAYRKLDFFFLTSSISAHLGGLGLLAYAASNIFMDMFAYQHAQSESQWFSINWDHFATEDELSQETTADLGATIAQLGMTNDEFVEIFKRTMMMGRIPQVIISSGDLGKRLDQWVKLRSLKQNHSSPKNMKMQPHKRPNLKTPYAEPQDIVQQRVADVWQELLGVTPIGIHDDFFELGGHSLLGTQITSRLREAFQLDVPLRTLLENRTIANLALAIEEQIISQIENLDEEEARRLLT